MAEQPCWLCCGLGGIAVHVKASALMGVDLWVPHRPESSSHPVRPCPVCTGNGHEIARAQIERHGKDRYPHPVLQFYKIMDELRELGVALERSRASYVVTATEEVRSEYADVGLALYELGSKLGLDLIDEMTRLVHADQRKFT